MKYNAIMNGIKLPEVLSNEETNYYFKLFKEGDMCARDVLINHNIKLVIMIVQKYFSTTQYEFEELFSVGIIGLIKAIDSFDMDKTREISTYASKCIKNEILMHIRKECKDLKVSLLSLDGPTGNHENAPLLKEILFEENEYSLEEKIIDEEIVNIRNNIILDVINSLNDIERKVVMMYFGLMDGKLYKQREIALEVNISRSRISRILENALKKIKKRLLIVQNQIGRNEYVLTSKKLVK